MRIELDISHKFFETYGTGTLIGVLLVKAGSHMALTDVTEVHLVFHASSLAWRASHGGPYVLMMPEFAPMCFLENIMDLVRHNIRVTWAEKPVNPSE